MEDWRAYGIGIFTGMVLGVWGRAIFLRVKSKLKFGFSYENGMPAIDDILPDTWQPPESGGYDADTAGN